LTTINPDNLIEIGFVSRPQGFKGELLFAIEYGEPGDYDESDYFFLLIEGKPVPFYVEEIRNQNGMIVKLEDVNDEAEAKKLAGKKILVKKEIKDTESVEINLFSLIGYKVFDATHGLLGPLDSIDEMPQQYLGRCFMNGKEILFPLTDELISGIDHDKKELHVDLPDGLIELYLN